MENPGTQGQARKVGGGAGTGEQEESPQSLYSLLLARMAMVKNFVIATLDRREREAQVLSLAPPPSCSLRPAAHSLASLSLQAPSMPSFDARDGIDALVPAAPAL